MSRENLGKGGALAKAHGEIVDPGLSWRSFFSEMSGFDGLAPGFTSLSPAPRMFNRASRSVGRGNRSAAT